MSLLDCKKEFHNIANPQLIISESNSISFLSLMTPRFYISILNHYMCMYIFPWHEKRSKTFRESKKTYGRERSEKGEREFEKIFSI